MKIINLIILNNSKVKQIAGIVCWCDKVSKVGLRNRRELILPTEFIPIQSGEGNKGGGKDRHSKSEEKYS
jgi:hypothetical protein